MRRTAFTFDIYIYIYIRPIFTPLGTSILNGGINTFLGVMPLALSSSDIFYTIFICFVGMVVFGSLHGLIVLPVLLRLFGPNVVLEL